MLWRSRPKVRKLARKHDAGRLVEALSYRDHVSDSQGRLFDLGTSTRRDAAIALAWVPDAEDVDVGQALVKSLNDSSVEVRRAAAWALGARREVRGLSALGEAALTWDNQAGTAAGEALLELAGPEAAAALIPVIVRDHSDLTRARVILDSVVAAGGDPALIAARDAAIQALSGSDMAGRERAGEILVWLGSQSLEPLLAMLPEPGPGRPLAVRVLGRLRDVGSAGRLVALLSEDDPEVRLEAAVALGEISDRGAIEPLMEATSDSDYGVRTAALQSLQRLGGFAVAVDHDDHIGSALVANRESTSLAPTNPSLPGTQVVPWAWDGNPEERRTAQSRPSLRRRFRWTRP